MGLDCLKISCEMCTPFIVNKVMSFTGGTWIAGGTFGPNPIVRNRCIQEFSVEKTIEKC